MKQTLLSEKEIEQVIGKFIIEVNYDDPIFINEVSTSRLSFLFEKRIRFVSWSQEREVSRVVITCPYGLSYSKTKERFVEYFNGTDTRFHRLLTSKELDVLFKFIKEKNY